MQPDPIAAYAARYAALPEEELAYIVATKRDHLTPEAWAALRQVLKTRNLGHFFDEVDATVEDLNSQVRAAAEEVAAERERRRRARRGLAFLAVFVVVLAGLMSIYYAQ